MAQIVYELKHLRVRLVLFSSGEGVIVRDGFDTPTYEHIDEGVSYFLDDEGLVVWEKGSKDYYYDYDTAYVVKYEPLFKGWIRQLELPLPTSD